MSIGHSYGLDWIDEDALFEVTRVSFAKVLQPSRRKPLPPDPFTLLAHAVLANEGLSEARAFERERAINKTLSDNVGYWHQRVLGLAPHWEETGASGGSIDLRTKLGYVHPLLHKPVLAEVKNRFNTIKASDEKNVWDRLDNLARASGAVAYVFQIVPKSPERYDRPWSPSGRNEKQIVRVCDGVSAYSLVFERQEALYELYMALPHIFADIIGRVPAIDVTEMEELFRTSMPPTV
ncbi:MAG: Eco47II family restriction endonuclease [Varibaculum sp.]|nr:Eco47II family restriction endonuclease [Varibaculum sp.]